MRVEAREEIEAARFRSFQRSGGREESRAGEKVDRSLIVRTTMASHPWSRQGSGEAPSKNEERAGGGGGESEEPPSYTKSSSSDSAANTSWREEEVEAESSAVSGGDGGRGGEGVERRALSRVSKEIVEFFSYEPRNRRALLRSVVERVEDRRASGRMRKTRAASWDPAAAYSEERATHKTPSTKRVDRPGKFDVCERTFTSADETSGSS